MNTSSFVCVLCKFGNEKIQICANSKILEMHTTDTKKRRTAEFLLPHNISQGCAMRVCGNKNIFKKKEKSLKKYIFCVSHLEIKAAWKIKMTPKTCLYLSFCCISSEYYDIHTIGSSK